jgi:8-oxo-dGTP pyrophosphatase MutT (NUDIX family)
MREAKEYGGRIVEERQGLLVKVANSRGGRRTFPKGHLEKKETPLEAALREVEEETGWKCRSVGPLALVRYRFNRNGRPVAKKVRWYRMEPVEKTGSPDEVEIMKTKWMPKRAAAKKLTYPSDLRLIARYLGKA